eukprot:TRINITY_DN2569_c0_g1_i1.p1 TRINITY_DN2569_c0_g1~~TRINITY_DN2569_c0_g1_i1.p1  ORF type:complete len:771 (-),score=247.62 TRINITY_DN2569_c0_g1_i1:123-2339(-)
MCVSDLELPRNPNLRRRCTCPGKICVQKQKRERLLQAERINQFKHKHPELNCVLAWLRKRTAGSFAALLFFVVLTCGFGVSQITSVEPAVASRLAGTITDWFVLNMSMVVSAVDEYGPIAFSNPEVEVIVKCTDDSDACNKPASIKYLGDGSYNVSYVVPPRGNFRLAVSAGRSGSFAAHRPLYAMEAKAGGADAEEANAVNVALKLLPVAAVVVVMLSMVAWMLLTVYKLQHAGSKRRYEQIDLEAEPLSEEPVSDSGRVEYLSSPDRVSSDEDYVPDYLLYDAGLEALSAVPADNALLSLTCVQLDLATDFEGAHDKLLQPANGVCGKLQPAKIPCLFNLELQGGGLEAAAQSAFDHQPVAPAAAHAAPLKSEDVLAAAAVVSAGEAPIVVLDRYVIVHDDGTFEPAPGSHTSPDVYQGQNAYIHEKAEAGKSARKSPKLFLGPGAQVLNVRLVRWLRTLDYCFKRDPSFPREPARPGPADPPTSVGIADFEIVPDGFEPRKMQQPTKNGVFDLKFKLTKGNTVMYRDNNHAKASKNCSKTVFYEHAIRVEYSTAGVVRTVLSPSFFVFSNSKYKNEARPATQAEHRSDSDESSGVESPPPLLSPGGHAAAPPASVDVVPGVAVPGLWQEAPSLLEQRIWQLQQSQRLLSDELHTLQQLRDAQHQQAKQEVFAAEPLLLEYPMVSSLGELLPDLPGWDAVDPFADAAPTEQQLASLGSGDFFGADFAAFEELPFAP